MSKTYRLRITSTETGPLVFTDGDLNAIAYHVSKTDLDAAGEYAVHLAETSAIAGDEKDTISALTADGEVVSLVLKKKIRQERAAENAGLPADGTETVQV